MRTALGLVVGLALLSSACTHQYKVARGRPLPATQVDRARGALEGAGLGVLAGVTGGAVFGYLAGDDPPCTDSQWFCIRFSAEDKALFMGAFGAGVGAASGLVIGALTGSTSEYAYEDGVVPQVQVVAAPGQASASAAWKF